MDPLEVKLTGPRGKVAKGIIRQIELVRDVLSWLTTWYPKMVDLAGQSFYEDSHWDVMKIWEFFYGKPEYRVLAD